ncbi:MAG: MoxR family ATPase [Victivallales bacterium]|nr:MoxR family ATPase [Victivallales bacterium]
MITAQEFVTLFSTLEQAISQVIEGKPEAIRRVLTAFFAGGHVLLEDLPGVGKTRLAQTLARALDAVCHRIQFTPDMLPNDIIGVSVYNDGERAFQFMPGPVFANIVLADEINRGTPRVQSSLLEAMAEGSVTVDSQTRTLPQPFFVIATQNPVEFHGTYPLPEAQMDRFLMRISLGYPDFETEKAILDHQQSADPMDLVAPVADTATLIEAQLFVREIHASERLKDYLVTIIHKTRENPAFLYGASPRAALALLRAAQCHAAIQGRDHVLPRDVRDLAPDVLSHRLPLRNQSRAQWHDSRAALADLLDQLPMRRWEE